MAESIDKLTVDKENLEKKYKSLQLEKESLAEQIQAKKTHMERLESEREQLQSEVQKLKETELLLLKYPDLYGPIEQLEQLSVSEEMENQIDANRHRIALLQTLNSNLSNSVRKLNDATLNDATLNDAKFRETSTRNQSLVVERRSIEVDERDCFMRANEAAKRGGSLPKRQYPLFRLDDEIEAEARQK
jgi:hypothetical protein